MNIGRRVTWAKFKELQNKDPKEIIEDAKEFARQKPGQTILISAAIGLVIGFLFETQVKPFYLPFQNQTGRPANSDGLFSFIPEPFDSHTLAPAQQKTAEI